MHANMRHSSTTSMRHRCTQHEAHQHACITAVAAAACITAVAAAACITAVAGACSTSDSCIHDACITATAGAYTTRDGLCS